MRNPQKQVLTGALVALLGVALWWVLRNKDTVEPRPLQEEVQSSSAPAFEYNLASWERVLPPSRKPSGSQPVPFSTGSSVSAQLDSPAPELATKPEAETIPTDPALELSRSWAEAERAHRGYPGWDHFLDVYINPLFVESDGLSFYDPTEVGDNPLLPTRNSRGFGFGLQFRTSF